MMVTVHGFKGSALPLTAEVASLIEKQTPALRSQIRGLPFFRWPGCGPAILDLPACALTAIHFFNHTLNSPNNLSFPYIRRPRMAGG